MSEPVRIRASSWGDLFDCAARWEAIHIHGKTLPATPPAVIGTAVHAGTAAFDASKGADGELTLDEAAAVAASSITNPSEDVDWTAGDFSPRDALWIATGLTRDYCRDWSPQYEFRSVEMHFKPLLVDTGEAVIELTGRMDRARVRTDADRTALGICDLKTGKQAVSAGRAKTAGHKFQLGVYELLAEAAYESPVTLPGEIIGLKTTGKREIATGEVVGAKELLLGTDDMPGALHMAGVMLKTGLMPPNPRSLLCSRKYCPIYSTCKAHD